MKPHPRIRKTVKWGGLGLTVLILVAWIGSRWREVGWYTASASNVRVAYGQFGFLYITGKGESSGIPGFHFEPVRQNFPMQWWFFWSHNAYWTGVGIPCWVPLLFVLPPTVVAWRRDALAERARAGLCVRCCYDRTGLAAGAVCPECGAGAPGGAAQR